MKLGYDEVVPFDFTNQAELLILLGRAGAAEPLLETVEHRIREGDAAFAGRANRVAYLRSLAALIANRLQDALRIARSVSPEAGGTALAAAAVAAVAAARLGLPASAQPAAAPGPDVLELWYWQTLEAWWRRDVEAAWTRANTGLAAAQAGSNDELSWRLAALASTAARARGQQADAARMATVASQTRDRIRARWSGAFAAYAARADLKQLDAWLAAAR